MLQKYLGENRFFKLVCGAGNEDIEYVKRLVYVYSLAGFKIFDISLNKEIFNAAKEGVKLAQANDVHFCVSVGVKGDSHIAKASINSEKCVRCGKCKEVCPQRAISEYIKVQQTKCIGCQACLKVCSQHAIEMTEKDTNIIQILPDLINNGVEIVELHINGNDEQDLEEKWNYICNCNPSLASISIDRDNFGNKEVISKIKKMISKRKPYSTIIQADGIPMSGTKDDYKTTLQAVAMAEIIQNANLPVYIIVSGGTNSRTASLCKQCDIKYSGIAIGSWARKIVKEYLDKQDFWQNTVIQQDAISIATELYNSCI